MLTTLFILFLLSVAMGFAIYFLFTKCQELDDERDRAEKKLSSLLKKYGPLHALRKEIEKAEAEILSLQKKYSEEREKASEFLRQKKAQYDRAGEAIKDVSERLADLEGRQEILEVGIYEPHFDLEDSTQYQKAILKTREKIKEMVKGGKAVLMDKKGMTDFDPAYDLIAGKMSKGQIRLCLRAFNSECETAMDDVRWNNVEAMLKRVTNTAADIEKDNAVVKFSINPKYVKLRCDELRLVHENREIQKAEKDARTELARAEREEKKIQAEAEAAEREEARRLKAVEKARKDAEVEKGRIERAMEALRAQAAAAGMESEANRKAMEKMRAEAEAFEKDYSQKIGQLESDLQEAIAASQKAQSMATLTKCGYVYIISNVGSFGPDVVKIGLTRRLDPQDRVKELGDASVPFLFDTHAMIYSENAPALEASLHNRFSERRVNLVNMRKEFFRVDLKEVETAIVDLAPEAAFFTDQDSQEYRETMARRKARLESIAGKTKAA